MKKNNGEKGKKICECEISKNNINFKMPDTIIQAVKNNNLVIFAGAGISTEQKMTFKYSLYSDIKYELNINDDENISFSDLMELYCEKPNGRRKLIELILQRFDYLKAFPEVRRVASRFHNELSSIYQINEIITTNWDTLFEEECDCIPIIDDKDIAIMNENRRRVYKIHGSIANFGTIVATKSDYNKCFRSLSKNVLGSKIKEILTRKTVVFIGYSMTDEDFQKMWKFLKKQVGEFMPHHYIVTINKEFAKKFNDNKLTVINTDGTFFLHNLKTILIEENTLLEDKIYYLAETMRNFMLQIHTNISNSVNPQKDPLIIYTTAYQDGFLHSLERISGLKSRGIYSNPLYILDSIESYDSLYNEYYKKGEFFDAAYIYGYQAAMIWVLYLYNHLKENNKENLQKFTIYFLFNEKNIMTKKEYKLFSKNFKTKKIINHAKNAVNSFGEINEIVLHHRPFI